MQGDKDLGKTSFQVLMRMLLCRPLNRNELRCPDKVSRRAVCPPNRE